MERSSHIFFAPYVVGWFFCGFALGIFLLWSGAVGGVVLVAVVLVGLGAGAELDIMPYMVSRYFGLRAFSELYSYAFAIFGLGAVVGPPLIGAGFDATGLYSLVLGGFVVTTLMGAGLMTQLGPYRVWEAGVAFVEADVERQAIIVHESIAARLFFHTYCKDLLSSGAASERGRETM